MSNLLMLLPGIYSICARRLPVAQRWADNIWMYGAIAAIYVLLGNWEALAVAVAMVGFFLWIWLRYARFKDPGSEKIPGRPRDYR